MTTEDDFQAALDADAADWQARSAFADWLEVRGDPRAAGYRALNLLRRTPALFEKVGRHWVWMNGYWAPFYAYRGEEISRALLPDDWYDRIPKSTMGRNAPAQEQNA